MSYENTGQESVSCPACRSDSLVLQSGQDRTGQDSQDDTHVLSCAHLCYRSYLYPNYLTRFNTMYLNKKKGFHKKTYRQGKNI